MKLHKREIENISKLEPYERYTYFIRKVADFEELWTITDKKGDLILSIIDDNKLVSFWTNEAFITGNLKGDFEKCIPFKMSLDDFEEKIIPLILENKYLLNIFSLNGKSGFIVDINEFVRDLNEELD